MKNVLLIFAVLALAVGLSGCVSFKAPVKPPVAGWYTHYKAPLMTEYKGNDFGTRKGTAQSHYLMVPLILFAGPNFAWSDAAMGEAAKDAGITTIKGADYEYLNILGIYAQFTIYVYGD